MRDAATQASGGADERRRSSTLAAGLDRLGVLDGPGLAAAWKARFGAPPPAALPAQILRLALAHDLQTNALGGLGSATERRLARIARGADMGEKPKPAQVRLKPGTTLLRDWGGRTWRVEVEANGTFRFEGKCWRSLSAIARAIIGTSRNGPAFYGLRAGGGNGPT